MENYNTQPEPSLKWHKFLIYFSLWAGALISVVSGLQLLTGSHYGGNTEQVYQLFSGLKTADTLFGILYLAIAVFMIYTRFQLAGFKQGAPGKLILVYVLQLIAFLAYAMVVAGAVHVSISEVMDSSTTTSLVASAVMIFVNRSYYGKRDHLFVN